MKHSGRIWLRCTQDWGTRYQALAWLEKDFQARSGLLSRVRWESPFESLRSDPRFADLLKRMGLKASRRHFGIGKVRLGGML